LADYRRREILLYSKAASGYDAAQQSTEEQAKLISFAFSQAHYPLVLDLGTGTGRYLVSLENYNQIIAVDISARMLENARERAHGKNIHLLCADMHKLPINQSCKFDLITSWGTIGVHSPITYALLCSFRALLKDSGVLFFSSNCLSAHWCSLFVRKLYELFRRSPDQHLLGRLSFPYQPYAESAFFLKRRLKAAGFQSIIRKKRFSGNNVEVFITFAKPSLKSEDAQRFAKTMLDD
jgi:ubiquinone/menaquinone biosynthesis C-methylase UbiE